MKLFALIIEFDWYLTLIEFDFGYVYFANNMNDLYIEYSDFIWLLKLFVI